MSEDFGKWISKKSFEVNDKIDEKSNRDNNRFVSINNEFLKTKEIKVYLSKESVISSIVADNSLPAKNNNVLKWFNDINLRKEVLQKFSRLLTESTKVLEFLETVLAKTPIKICKRRVQTLVKTLDHSLNNKIYNYSNEYHFKSIGYSIIKVFESESFLLKFINEVIEALISGIPIAMVAEGESSLFVSYIIDLCVNAGLPTAVINLVIVDNKTALNLRQTTEPMSSPIFIVLESADVDSAVDRIINCLINDTIGSLNVFVQQSVYQKFCQQIKTNSSNSLQIGDRFDTNVDILSEISINYDAIDFDNENKSFDIQVFKFRTNSEVKSLVNHFTRIPFISLWAEKTSLAIELSKIIDSTSVLYVNSSVKHWLKPEISVLSKVLDKTDIKTLLDKNIESILKSNKNRNANISEERLRIIREFFIKNETKVKISSSILEAFNNKITETKNNFGIDLVLTDFEPIGLLLFKIDSEFNQQIFTLILEALISGNQVVISCGQPIDDLIKFNQYLSSLNLNYMSLININDKQNKENTILMSAEEFVGIYLQNLSDISRNSLIKLKKIINLSMGDISFAK